MLVGEEKDNPPFEGECEVNVGFVLRYQNNVGGRSGL